MGRDTRSSTKNAAEKKVDVRGSMKWLGAALLCVPPSTVTVEGPDASHKGGRTVCKTRMALPAVPTGKK